MAVRKLQSVLFFSALLVFNEQVLHAKGDDSFLNDHNPVTDMGDDSCECIIYDDLPIIDADFFLSPRFPGTWINITTYGLGCAQHDMNSDLCNKERERCSSVVPVPTDCDLSWCFRKWCFVSPSCKIQNSISTLYKGIYYSYATCGDMDSFTGVQRIKSLKGRIFRVGFNSNTGGFDGAYNSNGDFATDNNWKGPIVEFIRHASLTGGFNIDITRPPAWIAPLSEKFYDSKSNFDYCVYATSLGYLDFCVATYTITDLRASTSTMFQTHNRNLYFITTKNIERPSWENFQDNVTMLFKPFRSSVWLMIVLFVVPMMGFIMLAHEYSAPGSAYPRARPMLVHGGNGRKHVRELRIPLYKHIVNCVYINLLSLFQGSPSESVMTLGGKIHLLGYSFFVLAVIAVYTANLAAILTQQAVVGEINSLESAVAAGWTFCSERKAAEVVMNMYDGFYDNLVVDPMDLGGDGKPGFDCEKCKARERVFDYIRRPNSDNSIYCDAAIGYAEDLLALQETGRHCDKIKVGETIAVVPQGIPIFDGIAEELVSFFYQLKNDNIILKEIKQAEPQSKCRLKGEEDVSLTLSQMTGIWIVTFSFAICGILAKIISRLMKMDPRRSRKLDVFDQWGNVTSHDIIIGSRIYDPGDHRLNELSDVYSRGDSFSEVNGLNRSRRSTKPLVTFQDKNISDSSTTSNNRMGNEIKYHDKHINLMRIKKRRDTSEVKEKKPNSAVITIEDVVEEYKPSKCQAAGETDCVSNPQLRRANSLSATLKNWVYG